MTELIRLPDEDLVSFYNRKLRARGVENREWYITSGGEMRLRDRAPPQSKLELD